jgi:hypothetical protein
MRITLFIIACAFLFSKPIFSQPVPKTPKTLVAKRTNLPVKIDGLLNDPAWKDAAVMTDLVEFRPTVGAVERPSTKTVAYLMYNDEGIYFGGYCYEPTKDSIARELTGRDGFGTNDYVGIIFDTYYDKLNAFEYFVTPLNEQWDARMSPPPTTNSNSEDFTWNAVWESGAVIHNDGWSFEMFIPFSAIRFGKKDIQDWGLNITRRRRKTEEQYTWNPIDPTINGFLTQEAVWSGISHIKPPLRLQFSPYLSTYVNHLPSALTGKNTWTSTVNGGMDVKYGINQAFTLDATLIPDFGQVQSDNQVLNLTPFEIKYTENRPFFNEGTELFSKGNLFYPRRIGLDPLLLHSVSDYAGTHEVAIKDPVESKLINATKISGRTASGFGLGIFNAITNTRYATLEDTITKGQRKVLIDPLTNYNMIVMNQSLKHNSSVSFVNTNVWRSGRDYDANVSAALFDLNDKTNTWNLGGKFALSNRFGYRPEGKTETGYSHSVYFGKTSGRFNFNIQQDLADTGYSSNDMGYFTVNNFLDHTLWLGYRWIKPTNWYNNIYLNFNVHYSKQVIPAAYRNAMINMNVNGQLKNLWFAGVLVGYEPSFNDFYEPRVAGRVFKGWSDYFIYGWVQTKQSNKYWLNTEILYVARSFYHGTRYQLNFSQTYRFNDKFSISHSIYSEPQKDNVGYASLSGSDIIFGRRDRQTIENVVNFKYNFNAKMGLNLRLRHYWSKVTYKEFFTLMEDGGLQKNTSFADNVNANVNFFNIDMVYTWQFAPGSFLTAAWKDAASSNTNLVERNYFKNFGNTVQGQQAYNFSVKVIYFLDYLNFRKWRDGRNGKSVKSAQGNTSLFSMNPGNRRQNYFR